ncbi:MAG: flagellar motor switch protein FliN [Candidatus Cybelea sp.]
MPLHLTVELGSAKMSVAEILKLGTGSIVELDRAVGHPVDLLVNDRPIARGEIVAVDESFALRITELLALE